MKNPHHRRGGVFLLFALILLGLITPAHAQRRRSRYDGDYGMIVRVDGRYSALFYTLDLRRGSSDERGDAELTVEKRGNFRINDRTGRDYGSIATVYLKDRQRVLHRGTWYVSGDNITISLTDIDGRKDNATFTGTVDRSGRLLSLRTSNTGMYGNAVSFRLERDYNPSGDWNDNNNGDSTPRDMEGEYRYRERRRIRGRDIELEYRLVLRRGGEAELSIRRNDPIRNDDETGRAFGSVATVYLKDRDEVYHTGRWSVVGGKLNVELTLIDGRRDRAVFTGDTNRDGLDLTSNNRGMYGDVRFRFDRR